MCAYLERRMPINPIHAVHGGFIFREVRAGAKIRGKSIIWIWKHALLWCARRWGNAHAQALCGGHHSLRPAAVFGVSGVGCCDVQEAVFPRHSVHFVHPGSERAAGAGWKLCRSSGKVWPPKRHTKEERREERRHNSCNQTQLNQSTHTDNHSNQQQLWCRHAHRRGVPP